MINYRSFRNSDTPLLVDVWRAQPPMRGLAQPVSSDIFEQLVLAKPYFENEGLIVALDGRRALGFVHAGFGPSEYGSGINRSYGVTCLLMVRPDWDDPSLASGLLARSEEYLTGRGAKVLYGGGIRPLDPFYRGLYGGAELPGVLAADTVAHAAYRAGGYREIDRVVICERELAGFRPPIDRRQMQIRRTSSVVETPDAPPRSWWEACALDHFQVVSFDLIENDSADPAASARFWIMETFSAARGVRTAGLYELEVASDRRRFGLATFLLGDAFRRLAAQGVAMVEVQTMIANTAARQLYSRLGFQEVDQGIAYRKYGPSTADDGAPESAAECGDADIHWQR